MFLLHCNTLHFILPNNGLLLKHEDFGSGMVIAINPHHYFTEDFIFDYLRHLPWINVFSSRYNIFFIGFITKVPCIVGIRSRRIVCFKVNLKKEKIKIGSSDPNSSDTYQYTLKLSLKGNPFERALLFYGHFAMKLWDICQNETSALWSGQPSFTGILLQIIGSLSRGFGRSDFGIRTCCARNPSSPLREILVPPLLLWYQWSSTLPVYKF